jgi:hypothetical protein
MRGLDKELETYWAIFEILKLLYFILSNRMSLIYINLFSRQRRGGNNVASILIIIK